MHALIGDCLPESPQRRINYSMIRVARNKLACGKLSPGSRTVFALITTADIARNSARKSPRLAPFNSLST
jgi:hypothetical protein